MVNQPNARQFEGFDVNDYVFLDSSAIPVNPNNIALYVVGTQANALVPAPPNLAALMIATPVPTRGGPPTSIGPQFPWAYEGAGPVQGHLAPANTPINPMPAQRTLIRVINNDMNVYFLNARLLAFLEAFLIAFPNAAAAGPDPVPPGGAWPLPLPVTLQVEVGLYQFERKWKWLLWERTVDDADGDLELHIEG